MISQTAAAASKMRGSCSWVSSLVVVFCVGLPFVAPLYFHIGETERKCFIEEIPDETMVIGKTN